MRNLSWYYVTVQATWAQIIPYNWQTYTSRYATLLIKASDSLRCSVVTNSKILVVRWSRKYPLWLLKRVLITTVSSGWLRPGRSKIELVWPSTTACESVQRARAVLHPPNKNFSNLMLWDCFWCHFWTLICSSWQAEFWFSLGRLRHHVHRLYGLVPTSRIYFCTNTKWVPDSLHTCITKLGGGQRTRLTRNCCH